ncbi:MAG: hypothetical protein AAF433_08995 [Bacteroidota bacterium]
MLSYLYDMSENEKQQPAVWPLLLAPAFYFGLKYGLLGGNSMSNRTNVLLLVASIGVLLIGREISKRMQG